MSSTISKGVLVSMDTSTQHSGNAEADRGAWGHANILLLYDFSFLLLFDQGVQVRLNPSLLHYHGLAIDYFQHWLEV